MCLFHKGQHTLAIIGNGFDRAHGFATTYRDFAENTSAPSLKFFQSCCANESSITTWFLFEKNIQILTHNLFQQSFTEDCDYDGNRKEVARLRDAFQDIHTLLIQYLRRETAGKPVPILRSVKKYLKPNTTAINFNYTKVAEAYTNHIIYVHGSLEEDDILLGYDYRDEPCLAQYADLRWGKIIRREALAFRRYLKKELGLEAGSPEYKRLTSSLEAYQESENSGRGIDIDAETYIPDFRFIDAFMKRYRDGHDIPEIDYRQITTIVVLGHGIEADQVYLNRILSKCGRLKRVVIYRHCRETDSEFKERADFFRPYCKKIRSVPYR